jgi:hypothetical protein
MQTEQKRISPSPRPLLPSRFLSLLLQPSYHRLRQSGRAAGAGAGVCSNAKRPLTASNRLLRTGVATDTPGYKQVVPTQTSQITTAQIVLYVCSAVAFIVAVLIGVFKLQQIIAKIREAGIKPTLKTIVFPEKAIPEQSKLVLYLC